MAFIIHSEFSGIKSASISNGSDLSLVQTLKKLRTMSTIRVFFFVQLTEITLLRFYVTVDVRIHNQSYLFLSLFFQICTFLISCNLIISFTST